MYFPSACISIRLFIDIGLLVVLKHWSVTKKAIPAHRRTPFVHVSIWLFIDVGPLVVFRCRSIVGKPILAQQLTLSECVGIQLFITVGPLVIFRHLSIAGNPMLPHCRTLSFDYIHRYPSIFPCGFIAHSQTLIHHRKSNIGPPPKTVLCQSVLVSHYLSMWDLWSFSDVKPLQESQHQPSDEPCALTICVSIHVFINMGPC